MPSSSSTAYQEEEKQETVTAIFRLEELRADTPLYPGYAERPYNPDEVAKKKPPFGIYDEMRRDDQVKAVLWLKKFIILSSGWDFDTKEDGQEEIVDDLKQCICSLDNPDFGDALLNILTHLDFGFSISEPVFDIVDTEAGQKVWIKKLKTKAPHGFTIYTDDFGNITEIEQFTNRGYLKVPPGRFLHLIHQFEFGVPYGISDLQAAYRAWFSKDKITKFWNIYLERFGNPHVVATLPTNTSKEDKERMLDIIKNLQAKTGITIPEGGKVEIIQPPTGNTGFENAINSYNMMIARSLLVPDLIGLGGGGITGGSFALGEEHFRIFFMTVEKIRRDLERIINRKVIQPMLEWNYGMSPGDGPSWKIQPTETKEKIELLRLWSDAVRGNIWDPSDEEINNFRQLVKFPTGDVKRKELPTQRAFPFSKRFKKVKTFQATRELTLFEKRVDFKSIEALLERASMETQESLSSVYAKIKNGLIDAVQSKRIVEGKKFDVINDLNLKFMKDLQMAWRLTIRDMMNQGKQSASAEISNLRKTAKMQDERTIAEVLEDTINERSYFIAGLERDKLKKQAAIILNRVIEQGLTTDEAVYQLGKLFDDYTDVRLETVVRTEMARAFNVGRKVIFDRETEDGFIEAYQYSAIIDSRTTEICRALDGKIYRADDPYVDRITPPRHFNCRSLLVPVIQGDDYEIDKHAVSEESLQSFDGTSG